MHAKCSEAKAIAMQIYQSAMSSQLDGTLPRDSDEIRQVQQAAIEECMVRFQAETVGVSALSSEKYLGELTVRNSMRSPHVRKFGFRNRGKILLVEYGILGLESGISLDLETGIRNPRCGIQNSRGVTSVCFVNYGLCVPRSILNTFRRRRKRRTRTKIK